MMDPKLAAILKKSKMIDQAATKFDKDPNRAISQPSSGRRSMMTESNTGGLFDSLGIESNSTPIMDVNSDMYSSSVENSKLPPAIKEAMINNPIQQPDSTGIGGFDDDMVNEIRNTGTPQEPIMEPEDYYNDSDEKELNFEHPIQQQPRRESRQRVVNEEVTNVGSIRQMIAEEIAKALPVVIEDYFDKRVIKENVQFKAGNTTFSGTVSPLPKKRTKKQR